MLVALWMLAVLNQPFWASLWRAAGGWQATSMGWLLTLPLFVLAWVWLSLEALTWDRAAKPVLCVLLPAAAATAYFMQTYGIVFDRGMLANVLETDLAEVQQLLSPSLFAWVIGLGVLPAFPVARLPMAVRNRKQLLRDKALTAALLLLVAAALLASFSAAYASLFRNHRVLRHQIVPTNVLAAVHGYAKVRLAQKLTLEPVAADATRLAGAQRLGRPLVTVIVVGETARAQNLALNGYRRPTTPALSARTDLINFGRAQACGTATSLPCMFLDVGRSGYVDGMAYRRESLLDVLQRAGLDVMWVENNSGCKGVCDRVTVIDAKAGAEATLCNASDCQDEVLLDVLWQRLAEVRRDTVVVLHLKGQHGPAYYLRYPADFERFLPTCKTNQLDQCEPQAIVNAYDNALGYSDHVLDWAITLLQAQGSRIDAALLFVSDHGESLGERGLFLHGMPYELAPAEQKEVPFHLWLAPSTITRLDVDTGCLMRRRDTLSNDNVYHTVLSLVGVRGSVYRPSADALLGCGAGGGGRTRDQPTSRPPPVSLPSVLPRDAVATAATASTPKEPS